MDDPVEGLIPCAFTLNRDIGGVIGCLASGRLPEREASIAAVKPGAEVTAAVIGEFDE